MLLDAAGRGLPLRRSAKTVTCPDAWSLICEHSAPGESLEETARRALREELGLVPAPDVVMLGPPVPFRTDYSRAGGLAPGISHLRKRDLQATAFLAARLASAFSPRFVFDDDVATSCWLTQKRLTHEARADEKRNGTNRSVFCNRKIRQLLRLAMRRLGAHENETGQRPSEDELAGSEWCHLSNGRVATHRGPRTRTKQPHAS